MIYLWVLVGIIGRLIIHIPDVTPLTTLSLLAPTFFSKRFSILIMLIILLLSDLCLHFMFHYSVFGSWTLFTYSGWMAIVFLGFALSKKFNLIRACTFTLFSSVFFWVWTNFGTWIATHMYAHTFLGLVQCYIAALPFLRNSVIGAMSWTVVVVTFVSYSNVCLRDFRVRFRQH